MTITNNQINSFMTLLCEEFSLDRAAVDAVWSRVAVHSDDVGVEETKGDSPDEPAAEGYTEEQLRKKTIMMLKGILRDQGKRLVGKKDELIARILGNDTTKASSTPSRQKLTKKPKSAKARDQTTLGRIYEANRPKVTVRVNEHGNHEHPDTRLVFRGTPPLVYGVQQDDGSIAQLTEETIALCNQYAFKYEQPSNLAATTQAADVEDTVSNEISNVEKAIREMGQPEDSEDELEDDGGIL